MGVILITGTSSGLGLRAAVELARRGERVFASMRDLSRDGELQDAARAAGVTVEVVQLDVTDEDSVQRAVRCVLAQAGAIDVVVNNAAVVAATGPLEHTTDAEVRRVFDTNAFGPLRIARAVLPSMRERKHGRIVNIATGGTNGRGGIRLFGIYLMTKAALTTLTLELAKEVRGFGIEVVLLDAGIGGATSIFKHIREQMSSWDPGSPYAALQVIASQQVALGSGIDPTPAVEIIADACTLPAVPLRYPAAFPRTWEAVSDVDFLKLCDGIDVQETLAKYGMEGGMWAFTGQAESVQQ